nr:uncharacterized protein LOC128692484 [Cherax quadricarinatus]
MFGGYPSGSTTLVIWQLHKDSCSRNLVLITVQQAVEIRNGSMESVYVTVRVVDSIEKFVLELPPAPRSQTYEPQHARRMLVVLVVVVHGGGGEEVSAQHHQHWLSSNHDLLSALTWASLDHNYLNQPTLLTSLENLNLTSIESLGGSGLDLSFLEGLNKTSGSLTSTDLTFALYRPRRKRNLAIVYNQLLNIQVEVKLLFPLLNIYASDNLNIEVPFAYQMNIPVKTKTLMVGKEEEEVPLEEAIDDMTSDLEGLIAM